MTLADDMNVKLSALYPEGVDDELADFTGDRYMAWVADNGPEWEDLLAFVETEMTPLEGWDAWVAYWATPVEP